jgi:hypothetical protein
MFFNIDFRDSMANLNAGFIFRRNWAGACLASRNTIRLGVHNMSWTNKA